MRRRLAWVLVVTLALAALLLGWSTWRAVIFGVTSPAPPRAAAIALPPPPPSVIALPVRLPMALLRDALERAVPTTLWAIDEPGKVCIPAQRLKLFDAKLKVTPDIRCRIVGTVTRGPIRLAGRGDRLVAELPLSAAIAARDIGGIIKAETATAVAVITADVRPDIGPDGSPLFRLRLRYDWELEPGVTVLGQRIRLTERAERELAPVLAKAEKDLSKQLVAPVQAQLAQIWRSGFTVQPINKRNPAAWLRLTPQKLAAGRIRANRDAIALDVELTALAEVHLGSEPAPPKPTPLPPVSPAGQERGLVINVAVLSDYATLENLIDKALTKLAARGIDLPDYGRVRVKFRRPILYGTGDGRLALGLDVVARGPRQLLDTRGRVWLTARAETAPGSETVLIRDMQLFTTGAKDRQLPLLLAVAQAPVVRATLESALTQDFGQDYHQLLARIDTALMAVPVGNFRLTAELDRVAHGKVLALGQGVYLPVAARGCARLDYAPR